MFAISVPIFVLMSVYGHYGKQLEWNNSEADKKIKPGVEFVTIYEGKSGLAKIGWEASELYHKEIKQDRGTNIRVGFGSETETLYRALKFYGTDGMQQPTVLCAK